MDMVLASINQSEETKPQLFYTYITDIQYEAILAVNCVSLCCLIGMFGIVTNMINLIVFCKQGLDTSINITFFAMAISDLSSLLLQQIFNVYVNPWFEKADVMTMPSEFAYLTVGIPRPTFTRITCMITVYMTMERCLCIMFPLHVKQMITPRRTTITMIVIYIVTWLSVIPLYCTGSIGWKFYPDRNKTLLGLVTTSNNDKLTPIVYVMLTFFGFALFASVVIFTAILYRQLAKKSKWRKAVNVDKAKSETMSNRDRKTGVMVALIATILIVCNTPSAILFGVTFIVPEFNIVGRYQRLCVAMWSFGVLFETINSSANIFLYLKMSTKYRETFNVLLSCKQK